MKSAFGFTPVFVLLIASFLLLQPRAISRQTATAAIGDIRFTSDQNLEYPENLVLIETPQCLRKKLGIAGVDADAHGIGA